MFQERNGCQQGEAIVEGQGQGQGQKVDAQGHVISHARSEHDRDLCTQV